MTKCATPKCGNEATQPTRFGWMCQECAYAFHLVGDGATEKSGVYGVASEADDDGNTQLDMFEEEE